MFSNRRPDDEPDSHTGRRKINDKGKGHASIPAMKGKFSVEYEECPHCRHHKVFVNADLSGKHCCRCKKDIEFGGNENGNRHKRR